MRLNHGIDQDGDPAGCFGYHDDAATCPVFTVNGREIILLRSWRAALEGLRNPYLRDLAAIEPDAAIAGITRERPGGLLRRSGPDTSIRTALNPMFAPPAVERWRPGLRALARRRARELPAEADLIRDFCAPLADDLACLTAGLQPAEWDRLNCLGVRANALVLGGHQDIDLARAELHDFCTPLVERSRHEDHLLSACVRVMDEHGMPPGEVVDACTTIYGGYASVLPTLTVIVYETVSLAGRDAAVPPRAAAAAPRHLGAPAAERAFHVRPAGPVHAGHPGRQAVHPRGGERAAGHQGRAPGPGARS